MGRKGGKGKGKGRGRGGQASAGAAIARGTGKGADTRTCHWCLKPGHLIADCRAKAAGKPRASKGKAAGSLEQGDAPQNGDYTAMLGDAQARDCGGLDRDLWSLERATCDCCPDYVLPGEPTATLCDVCKGCPVDVLEWDLNGGVWPEEEQDDDEQEDLPAPLLVGVDGWPLDTAAFPTPSSTRLSLRGCPRQ